MRREREREKERKVEGRGEGVAGERGCGVASVPAQWPGHRVLCLVLCALFSLILFDSRPPPPPPPHHHHHHHHHDPPTTEIAPFYHLSWTLVRGPVRPRTILSLSPHIRCDSDQRHLLSLSLFLSLPLSPRRSFHYIRHSRQTCLLLSTRIHRGPSGEIARARRKRPRERNA